jgi:hypothetical protein
VTSSDELFTETVAEWLRHPLLLAPAAHDFMPGANGVAVQEESVYISNTAQALLLRCSTATRNLVTIAENLTAGGAA